MNENIKKDVLIFETNLSVEFASQISIDNPRKVRTKGRNDHNLIDILQTSVALHIGKSDPDHDAILTFPVCDVVFQIEIQFIEVKIKFHYLESQKVHFNMNRRAWLFYLLINSKTPISSSLRTDT